jgi:hypothetical protein
VNEKPAQSKNLLDIPTYKRDRQQTESTAKIRPVTNFGAYPRVDEDQYDIPTFLRKSVD